MNKILEIKEEIQVIEHEIKVLKNYGPSWTTTNKKTIEILEKEHLNLKRLLRGIR